MGLERLRERIDATDRQLLDLLAKRKALVLEISKCKKENNMQLRQPERERQLLAEWKAAAKELGLRKEFVEKIFWEIIKESLKIEADN